MMKITTLFSCICLITFSLLAFTTAAPAGSDRPIPKPVLAPMPANTVHQATEGFKSSLDDCFIATVTEHAVCRNESQIPIAVQAAPDPLERVENLTGTLIETVRQATERFNDIDEAQTAGYGLFHGCVSGPQEGAMGVHFVNGDLVGDGVLDPAKPEALLYEFKNGQMQLLGVEYVVITEAWHANNEAPPMLMGQLFNYVGSPNRYGIPAFYELHVWAWRGNPLGTFADWNPRVSCDSYTVEDAASLAASH